MTPFKFFHDFQNSINPLSGIIYGWNVYEQIVMNAYKFCYDNDAEFIGFTQPFRENHIDKTLTVLNMFVDSETHTDIIYQIVDGRQSIYTLRINNEDLFSIEQYENV